MPVRKLTLINFFLFLSYFAHSQSVNADQVSTKSVIIAQDAEISKDSIFYLEKIFRNYNFKITTVVQDTTIKDFPKFLKSKYNEYKKLNHHPWLIYSKDNVDFYEDEMGKILSYKNGLENIEEALRIDYLKSRMNQFYGIWIIIIGLLFGFIFLGVYKKEKNEQDSEDNTGIKYFGFALIAWLLSGIFRLFFIYNPCLFHFFGALFSTANSIAFILAIPSIKIKKKDSLAYEIIKNINRGKNIIYVIFVIMLLAPFFMFFAIDNPSVLLFRFFDFVLALITILSLLFVLRQAFIDRQLGFMVWVTGIVITLTLISQVFSAGVFGLTEFSVILEKVLATSFKTLLSGLILLLLFSWKIEKNKELVLENENLIKSNSVEINQIQQSFKQKISEKDIEIKNLAQQQQSKIEQLHENYKNHLEEKNSKVDELNRQIKESKENKTSNQLFFEIIDGKIRARVSPSTILNFPDGSDKRLFEYLLYLAIAKKYGTTPLDQSLEVVREKATVGRIKLSTKQKGLINSGFLEIVKSIDGRYSLSLNPHDIKLPSEIENLYDSKKNIFENFQIICDHIRDNEY